MLHLFVTIIILLLGWSSCCSDALSLSAASSSHSQQAAAVDRRQALGAAAGLVLGTVVMTGAPDRTDAATMDTDAFLSSGGVAMPMGVSGQAGKSKPITNVVFPDGGLDVQRDPKTGNVLAEILVQKSKQPEDLMAVVTSFTAPWSLAKGMVYDVECRDAKTGDAAFLAVSPVVADNISSLKDLKDDKVLLSSVFGPRGRFSFYGVSDVTAYNKKKKKFSFLLCFCHPNSLTHSRCCCCWCCSQIHVACSILFYCILLYFIVFQYDRFPPM